MYVNNKLVFDGSNDYMMVDNFELGSHLTVFFVADLSAREMMLEHSADVNGNNGFYLYGKSGCNAYIRQSNGTVCINDGQDWMTDKSIARLKYDGSNFS